MARQTQRSRPSGMDPIRRSLGEFLQAPLQTPVRIGINKAFVTSPVQGTKTATLLGELKATDSGKIVVGDRDWDAFEVSSFAYSSDNILTVDSSISIADFFAIGDKVRLSQGGSTKYFYVVDFAGQLLQLSGGDDYTYTNGALESFETSRAVNPQGHPIFFEYATSMYAGGSGVTLTSDGCAFRMVGPVVEFNTFVTTSSFPSGYSVFSLTTPFVDINTARPNASAEALTNSGVVTVYVENENTLIGGGVIFSGIAQNVFVAATATNYTSGSLVFRAVTNAYLDK